MMTIDIRTRARRVKNYGFIVFDAKSKTQRVQRDYFSETRAQ